VDIADVTTTSTGTLIARCLKGLNKVAVDIVKSLFLTLGEHGVKLDRGIFDTLLSAYMRKAEDTMRFYAADAEINVLNTIATRKKQPWPLSCAAFVRRRDYLSDPLGDPMIPNWNRVEAALPDFLDAFNRAVQLDNK